MSVIVEFSIPVEEFLLGKALRETSGLSVELEQMIPTGGEAIAYFWVVGEENDRFNEVFEREPELSTFEVIDQLEGRWLYRAEWEPSADTFVQTMVTHDVVLQEADGDTDSWTFQLRFPDSRQLSAFHTDCRERDVDVAIENIYNPIEPGTVELSDLTRAQRSLIQRVHEAGYFEVPRRVTLVEIAEELDISDQAVNERLRRGLSTLIGATLNTGTGVET